MNKKLLIILVILGLMFLKTSVSQAITIIASPNPATVNQNVSVNIMATFQQTPICTIEVNFGDGSPWIDAGTCTVSPCNLIRNHIYTNPGTYTITARSNANLCTFPPNPPDPVTTSVLIQAPPITLSVSPVPSSFNIPRGQSSSAGINYQFTGSPSLNTTINSSSGSFMVGSETIETNPVPLTATIQNGAGRAPEVINIPVKVIERALQRGSNRVAYVRTFIGANISLTATVNLNITTEASADFEIKRVELYFENRRAEITIERNYPNLKAYADIRFTGSGLLRGYWEVDGRILSYVNQHLTFGRSVTLQTPETPPLPTFDTGTHIVRFVITNPVSDIPLPSILYFVTPTEFKGKLLVLRLITPENDFVSEYKPLTFRWEGLNKATFYLIEFTNSLDSKPLFSAFTRDVSYLLPELVLKTMFSPGQKYYWKVKGFDSENNIISESSIWSFSFKSPDAHVAGHILTVFSEEVFSEKLMNEIMQRHKLTIIETFPLKSLNTMVLLYKTDENIFNIIDELKKDNRILIAQPNYILRTMSDPLRKMQYANTLLNINKTHNFYKGKGIKVAIVDTGIDAEHNDLKDRVILRRNFIKGEIYSSEIHGTAIAGIIAANINGFGIEGVAPEAEILALRACRQASKERPEGDCFTDSISKALDEAILQKANIVNMSFGTTHYDSLLSKLIERGVEQGILYVAPAGNNKNDRELKFPASHHSVISVSGFDEKLNPYPNPEITKKTLVSAPAVNIITAVPGNNHNFMSGTSLSSAYISGLLTLALEKDKDINKQKLPVYKGDLCKWQEELLKISICEKKF